MKYTKRERELGRRLWTIGYKSVVKADGYDAGAQFKDFRAAKRKAWYAIASFVLKGVK